MTDFISMLQSAALQASELVPKREDATDLRWHLNYKWLINPPVQCPWCKEWIPTQRVWVVDEVEKKVRRVWLLNGTCISPESCHPHVGGGGLICMGNAPTAVDALTASISNDAYIKPWRWFPNELDHKCETMGDALDSDEDERYETCVNCEEYVSQDEAYFSEYTDSYYCEGCYWEYHTSCGWCGADFHQDGSESTTTTPEGECCNRCFGSYFFTCEGCDEVMRLTAELGDDRCEDCYWEKWESCRQCGKETEISDNELDDNNLCENCRPQESECLECHLDFISDDLVNGRCPDCWHKHELEEEEDPDAE